MPAYLVRKRYASDQASQVADYRAARERGSSMYMQQQIVYADNQDHAATLGAKLLKTSPALLSVERYAEGDWTGEGEATEIVAPGAIVTDKQGNPVFEGLDD